MSNAVVHTRADMALEKRKAFYIDHFGFKKCEIASENTCF